VASLYSGFCNDRNSRNACYLSLALFVMYTAVKVLELLALLLLAWLERIVSYRGCSLLERLRRAENRASARIAPFWPRQMSRRHLKGTTAMLFNANHFQLGCLLLLLLLLLLLSVGGMYHHSIWISGAEMMVRLSRRVVKLANFSGPFITSLLRNYFFIAIMWIFLTYTERKVFDMCDY